MDKSYLKIGGIKCDAEGCNFREEDIAVDEYEEWLDRPCPDCGENLLTEEDLNTVKMLMATVALANRLEEAGENTGPMITSKIEMDGTGEVKFTDVKLKDK